ncbi:hypothetical protein Tco_1368396 [Tanacetum coccineum]
MSIFLDKDLSHGIYRKQTIVLLSTTEAKYVAAANCYGQVLWVQNQLLDYGFNFMNTKIHIDNESTICIVKNPVYHSKTKHIEIRHHFILDCYEKKLIRLHITGYAIRDTLQLEDATGITMLPNDELFEGMGQMGSKCGGWVSNGSNIATALICLSIDRVYNFSKLIFDGQEHDAVAQSQPSSSTPPVPSTSSPPVQSPPPIPASIPTPTPIPETEPEPFEHTFEEPSPVHQHFSPLQDILETDLKQTKLTMGNALVKLVKKVKKLEGFLKRRNMVLSDSEEEEPEAQGRKSQDDPLDSLVQGLVTPSTTKVNASGEEQVEDISPNTLEAAKTLSRVASLKPKSIDKGRRYKRRKETKGKKVVSSLDFQEEVDTGAETSLICPKRVNTGSIKLSTVSEQVSTVSAKRSTPSPDKGQRAGKAPMIIEETPKKSKEQILQEEASLAEAIRLDTLQKEEVAKQVHLDSLLAQRIAEEEELNEQQKKRKAQEVTYKEKICKEEKDAAYHKEKMLLCKQEEAGVQLNAEQADWKDDTVGSTLYVQNNYDNYNVFAIENEHPEQPESVTDAYLEEQGDTNIIIDSLDMCYDRKQDDTNELAQERDLLASLIEKLKCEIKDSKNRNKFLESSNKALVDKLKGEIEDFKTMNKSLESSNNHFKEANNELSKTNQLMFKDLKKFQAELDRYHDVNYASKVAIDCAKAKGDLMSDVSLCSVPGQDVASLDLSNGALTKP